MRNNYICRFVIWSVACLISVVAPLVFADADTTDEDIATYNMLRVFADVIERVEDDYVEELDEDDLVTSAINGALSSLDPHSSFIPPEDFADRQQSARREYGGLGIEVTMEDDVVLVNYVNPGGPADKSGLKVGDKITAVEGNEVAGKTLGEAVEGMRGLDGEPVTIRVRSEGREERELVVIREVVQGRAVRHRVEDGLGYMYIETFNHPNLGADVKWALQDLKRDLGVPLPGLVIDVRGNPGGRVDKTMEVASLFLDGGEVFSARGRTLADSQRYHADGGELTAGTPIAVLVNSRSASAAEILAGAIQDRGRGIVTGRLTFGKGSVQSVSELSASRGALRLTTQRYYTPSGRSIQGRGIMPDVLVALAPESEDEGNPFRESSLPNALLNTDEDEVEEDKSAINYPPDDWPTDEDYQIAKTVEILKSAQYNKFLAAQK